MASIIVFFLLFILPFIIAPFGITQFENPKVIFAEAGIILLFLVLLFKNNIFFRCRGVYLTIYSCIILVTLIDIFFFRTDISFFGNAFRMQGIFLLWLFLLFSFLCSQITSFRVPWWIYLLLLCIETVVTFFLPLNASQRYVGTLGEPNALAAFAIFLWPFAWFEMDKATTSLRGIGLKGDRLLDKGTTKQSRGIKHKLQITRLPHQFANWFAMTWGKAFLLFLVCVILYVSGSRSGIVAFGIELVFLVGAYSNTPLQSLKRTTIICIFLYIVSYSLPFFEHVPYENRAEIWQSALYAGIISPGLGHGFGNTEIALHNAAAGIDLPIQYYYVDSSHNIFLDWWVQAGVIGVSLLLLLVYLTFRGFIQQQNRRELVLLFGMLTVLSFNPASVVGLIGFWWIIGRGMREVV